VAGGLFVLGLFFLPYARWPAFVKGLWLLLTGAATLGTLWAALKAFVALPLRDKTLFLAPTLALGALVASLEPARTWALILAYKLQEAALAQGRWQSWLARGEVYLPAESERGVYHLLPAPGGGAIAVSPFEVQRVALTGDGAIRKETLLDREGFRRAGVALTPLTDCAWAGERLLCMSLYGEVIERRQGAWRRLGGFPAPEEQFYDDLAVDPATGALFAWTGRGRHPLPEAGASGAWTRARPRSSGSPSASLRTWSPAEATSGPSSPAPWSP